MSAAETRIHNALIQNMPAGYHFDTHMHRTVEIFICLSGAITITVLGAPRRPRRGGVPAGFSRTCCTAAISPRICPCSIL